MSKAAVIFKQVRKWRQKASEEKHVSAKTRSEVLSDIQRLAQTESNRELRNYLIDLAKWGDKLHQYENEFRSYLYAKEADLREAAVFSLLFALQIRKPEYRDCALQQLTTAVEGVFDDRQWAAVSLAVAYEDTKDQALLRVFFELLDDEAADDIPKESLVGSILLVWGVSGRNQAFRVASNASMKTMLREFAPELNAAQQVT